MKEESGRWSILSYNLYLTGKIFLMRIKNFTEAEKFLLDLVPRAFKKRFPGEVGIERTRYFLDLLDNPQEKMHVVHVAGTSGKGSISFVISHLLSSLGFKTGLVLSPHLLDIRERMQVNNSLISKKKFVEYLNDVLPAFWETKERFGSSPSYFELLVVLAFFIFWKEKVRFAVIETGMGGKYDATNVVDNSNKVCVISRIGFDHMHILGNTLREIAEQKVGIVQKENRVVYLSQKVLNPLISEVIKKKNVEAFAVNNRCFNRVKISEGGTEFRFKCGCYRKRNLLVRSSLLGEFQVWNISLALLTLCVLSSLYNFEIKDNLIKKSLSILQFLGRLHVLKYGKRRLILDGAHNSQKMRALLSSLRKIFPGEKFVFLVAFKKRKNYREMMRMISPLAEEIITTSFSLARSVPPLEVAASTEFKNKMVVEDPKEAVEGLLKSMRGRDGVVCGSLYLLSEVYKIITDRITNY